MIFFKKYLINNRNYYKFYFMKIFQIIAVVIVCACVPLRGNPQDFTKIEESHHSFQDPFIEFLYERVLATIVDGKIEGMSSDQLEEIKPVLAYYWTEIVKTGFLIDEGNDENFRACFVSLQGIIEHVLSCELSKKISSLMGVIHTPQPATPLCTRGELSPELIDQSVLEDPLRALTVKTRAVTIRSFLERGGDLYIVYPKGGKALRTEEQQKIYEEALQQYATHLFDCEMARGPFEASENDLIGAFYLFSHQGVEYAFAIQITQANDTQQKGRYALWFGPLSNPAIRDRISLIQNKVLIDSKKNIPQTLIDALGMESHSMTL